MPDFQFLTTDNPEEFKKGNYLKQIRSHAMLSVKHNEQQQQRSKSGQASTKSASPSTSTQPSSSTSPPLVSEKPLRAGRPVKFVDYNPTKAAEKGSRKRSQQNQDVEDNDDDRAIAIIPRKSAKARTTFFARYADAVLGPRQVGRGADVLNTMPEFSNPKISVWDLKRQFDHLMLTETMKNVYFPAMDGCRHAFLSTACIKATYSDMLNGYVEESPATLYIKEEVYTMIRESLVDPKKQADDGMFMCIGQLLAAELVQGEEDVMMTHEQGLDRIAEHRGGLDKIGGQGVVANAISAGALVSSILREGEPPQRFFNHLTQPIAIATTTRLAESPIFCPRNDFYSISSLCSDSTLQILRDMRDMTNLFVHSENIVRRQTLRDEYPYPRQLSSQLWSFHNRMLDLPPNSDRSTFFDPSGGNSGGGASPDFVYEACRHAAILYSYAIAARVPISTAGQYFERAYPQMAVRVDLMKVAPGFCSHPPSSSASPSLSSADAGSDTAFTPPSTSATPNSVSSLPPLSSSTHPAMAIVDAIQRTPNAQDAWGDLVGVLLWVTFVATVAARAPPSARCSFGEHLGGGGGGGGGGGSRHPSTSSASSSSNMAAAAAAAANSPSCSFSTASSASPKSTTTSPSASGGASTNASSPPGWTGAAAAAAATDVQRDYERAKARKNLASMAILCTIKLGFEQPESIFPALRTFLRVQSLLRR